MRVISIGTDTKILDGGRLFNRQLDYAKLVNEYVIVIFTRNINHKILKQDNFTVIPVYGKNIILQVLKFIPIFFNNKFYKNNLISSQDPFEIGFCTYLICKIFRLKFLAQCHTDISHANFRNESKRNYLQYLIANFVFRKADKIRVVSERMRKYLIEELNINENKILKLPIYFDGVGGQNSKKTVDFLILSRLEKEKNIEVAIKAVEKVRQKTGQNLTLKIVGSGALAPSPEGGGLGWGFDWLTFAPWTNNPSVEYKNAKYLLLPSLYEGWALTAIEAVNNGTPVIMTDVGCAHEFIQNGVNGFITTGFDVYSFQEAIEKALNYNFDQTSLQSSLKNLMTKQEYLDNLKKFLNE